MICHACKKPIIDEHFKKTKKHFYHLDQCWNARKLYFALVPLILVGSLLVGVVFLIIELVRIL